jgi:hypothetical protein
VETLGFVRQVVTDAIKLDTMAAWLQAHIDPG